MHTLLKSFPHRHNADGSHDSICTACFATVAKVRNEDDLTNFESAHLCEPVGLYEAGQGIKHRMSFAL
jgi:hypothetical protein